MTNKKINNALEALQITKQAWRSQVNQDLYREIERSLNWEEKVESAAKFGGTICSVGSIPITCFDYFYNYFGNLGFLLKPLLVSHDQLSYEVSLDWSEPSYNESYLN